MFTIELFSEVAKKCVNYGQLLIALDLSDSKINRSLIKAYIKDNNIDISHFTFTANYMRVVRTLKLEDLCENSERNRGNIKDYIVRNNLLNHTKCSICNILNEWNGKKLILQLDHINGVNNDHRLENLRFICPNCHSQTSTYSNKRGHKFSEDEDKRKDKCSCGELKNRVSKTCKPCSNRTPKNKKFYASKEELEHLLDLHPMTKIGEIFKVSSTAIKRRCKNLQVVIPEKRLKPRKIK